MLKAGKGGGKWARWKKPYRIVFYDEESFNERWIVRSSRVKVALLILIGSLFLMAAVVALFLFTPVGQFVPGYVDPQLQAEKDAYYQAQIDTLERINEQHAAMLESFARVAGVRVGDSVKHDLPDMGEMNLVPYAPPTADSSEPYGADRPSYSAAVRAPAQPEAALLNLIAPVDGYVTKAFDPENKHFGIDLSAADNTFIRAASDGVVIFSEYSNTTGWVIGISHSRQKAVSFYKHNSRLFKKVGDYVFSGEAIAVIGNTGRLQSGTHLHFELWYENIPVDPADFILFE